MSGSADRPGLGDVNIMGDVGANARVAQGKYISWVEGMAALPDGKQLEAQFKALLDKIATDPAMDEDTQALAAAKTQAVADGLTNAQQSPGKLRIALKDAKDWFVSNATWVGHGLRDILTSEAAQKTLGTITEAATTAAIKSFTG